MEKKDKLRLIKSIRKEKGISQEELAKGICSVPYLSKIENIKADPSKEVLELLLEKLDLNPTYIDRMNISRELYKLYQMMQEKNIKDAEDLYKKIQHIVDNYLVDLSTSIYYKLASVRYYLLKKNFLKAKSFIESLQQIEDMFNKDMKYYYEKFCGQYYYLLNAFSKAHEHIRIAEKILAEIIFEDKEKYDLFYNIALTLSRVNRLTESIYYVRESLNYYNNNYNYSMAINCNILLSINFRRIGNYNEAMNCLESALKVATLLKDNILFGKIYHNLGFLHSLSGDSKTAIKYYKKSLKNKDEADLSRCQTYHSIVKEYLNLNCKKQGLSYCRKGLEFSTQKKKQSHVYHFNILASRLGIDIPNLEDYLKDEVIPYFEKKDAFEEVIKYTEMLARLYEEDFSYKKANELYKKIIVYLKKLNTMQY